jgi:agmatinase
MNLDGLRPWAGLPVVPLDEARIVIADIAYEASAVYRKGQAEAPAAIRRLSACMPPVDERGHLLQGLTVHELGDMEMLACVESGWKPVAERLGKVHPSGLLTVLGGDHCSAIPVMAAQAQRYPNLAVMWVDAHPDLCDFSRGGRWTCGCALRRALEVSGLTPQAVALVGCRDFDPEEMEFIQQHGMPLVTAAELAEHPGRAIDKLAQAMAGRPLHISFDIDALDPAHAPGTEIASAGGLTTRQVLQLMGAVASHGRLVGLDICEVCPEVDHADITVLAALKLIFETWSLVRGR